MEKKVKKFYVLKCWKFSLRAESFSCSLDVLHGGLWIKKLLVLKIKLDFFSANFFTIFGLQNSRSGSGSGSALTWLTDTIYIYIHREISNITYTWKRRCPDQCFASRYIAPDSDPGFYHQIQNCKKNLIYFFGLSRHRERLSIFWRNFQPFAENI
jgi:hypothetical protein